MKTYLDIQTEIELIKDQIEFIKKELEYWLGINIDTEEGIPLDSIGSKKYGTNTAVIQAKKKIRSLQKLQEQLKQLEYAKTRWDILLERLEGLDYKIAYKRIVESKTHREIAEELNFSEQYIRRRWMEIKRCNKHATDTIANA